MNPEKAKPAYDLFKQDWRFSYEPSTHFVSATHPQGGNQTVCEIKNAIVGDSLGFLIADLLNQLVEVSDELRRKPPV